MVAGPGRNELFTQDRIAADLDLNELWPPRNKEGSNCWPIKTNFCPKTIEDDRTVGDQYELLRPRIELLAIDMKGIEL